MDKSNFGFHKLCNELRAVLNAPLPGGRGFQAARDRRIQRLAKTLSECELPDRYLPLSPSTGILPNEQNS